MRVFGLTNIGKVRVSRWTDLPADQATDLLGMGFVSLTDQGGNEAPDVIPTVCCGH